MVRGAQGRRGVRVKLADCGGRLLDLPADATDDTAPLAVTVEADSLDHALAVGGEHVMVQRVGHPAATSPQRLLAPVLRGLSWLADAGHTDPVSERMKTAA